MSGATPSQSENSKNRPLGAVSARDAPPVSGNGQYQWMAQLLSRGWPSVAGTGIEHGQIGASVPAAPGPTVCIADQASSMLMFQNAEKFAANSAGSRRPGACR